MSSLQKASILFVLINALVLVAAAGGSTGDGTHSKMKTWIIRVQGPNGGASHLISQDVAYPYYASLLATVVDQGEVRNRIIYAYTSFDGFAARLSGAELEAIKKEGWFISAVPDQKLTIFSPPMGV